MKERERRPGWHDYFLEMAQLAASRSTCPRRHVGAVLVRDHRVIATGYNGSVRGDDHCEDVGCLMVDGHCRRTLHAELNALLQCAITGVSCADSTMYCTDFPCVDCAKAMAQARVRQVIYLAEYPDDNSAHILRRAGVQLLRARQTESGYVLE
ncbi:MAG: deoxycytidylate deaminase [Bacillota bacterium]